jgi:hypothetical protein
VIGIEHDRVTRTLDKLPLAFTCMNHKNNQRKKQESSVMTDKSPMAQILTLTSSSEKSLRPLIEAAIYNELRMLQAGIRRTQQRIADFEAQYGMTTAEFLERYRNDAITETLETIEWFGEWKMLERLREDKTALREVGFAD